ncbi:ribonuclease HII [Bacteriovoracaceae bacterium]|nr:ribonuclease HII [Bacteriovoracaceae bacterium]
MFDRQFLASFKSEKKYFVGGLDEVGRGPLAGPVVAGSVIFHWDKEPEVSSKFLKSIQELKDMGIGDSKALSEKKRFHICEQLFSVESKDLVKFWKAKKFCIRIDSLSMPLVVSLGIVSPKRIDKINILKASLEAMARSIPYGNLPSKGLLLIDGRHTLSYQENVREIPIIKGDQKSLLIGLASIIAKTYRDRLMAIYGKKFPVYLFDKNAGYPTLAHRAAIIKHGSSPIHRKSFRGVV